MKLTLYIFAFLQIQFFIKSHSKMPEIIRLSEPQKVSMADDWFELADPNHFWLKWRFQVLKDILKPFLTKNMRILEIGCGNGLVMWQFEKEMKIVIDGCDLNEYVLENMVNVSGKVYLYDIFDLNADLVGKYDLVILLDVIEHIDEDGLFLKMAKKHLKESGHIIVGVPAHQFLFSKYDRLLGHKRRYSKKTIINLYKSIDLNDEDIRYWGFSLLPLSLLRKYYLKLVPDKKVVKSGFTPPHPLFNWMIKIIMKIETSFFKNVFQGISIMALGRKKS